MYVCMHACMYVCMYVSDTSNHHIPKQFFYPEAILFECFLARSRTLVSHVVRLGLRWQLSCYCVLQCSKSSFGLQIGFKICLECDWSLLLLESSSTSFLKGDALQK